MEQKITVEVKEGFIHYFFDSEYLGMLVFEKGELSDFRAIIRKNRLQINKDNLYKSIRKGLFELLNQYLAEKLFLKKDDIQIEKTKIVKVSENDLKKIADKIIKDKGI